MASGCSPLAGSSAALMWRLEICTKKQTLWYCGRSSVSSGLSCRRSHIYRIEIRDMQIAAQCLKLGAFYWDWHAFSLKLWVFFHVVYCDDEKKIFCSSEYVMKDTNQIASLLLSLTELILLAINIGTSNMTKNIRSHSGCTSFIYFRTSRIYTSSLRITVQRKVPIAKIWGLPPLNSKFMTKLGLEVVIIGKIMYAVKVKNMSVYL